MNPYRQIYRRHRILFALPAVVFALAAGAYAYTAPKMYRSQASFWVNNPANSQTAVGNQDQAIAPATEEQTLLDELLAVKSFDLSVANHSPLKGTASNLTLAKKILNNTSSTVPGPQVLQLAFTGPSPRTAQDVLRSLLSQLQLQSKNLNGDFNTGAETYYRSETKLAEAALSKATAAATTYRALHPAATVQNDPRYASLMSNVTSANAQVNIDTTALDQAIAQAKDPGADGLLVGVLDAPTLPNAPTSGKKKIAELAAAGFVGGVVLSLLIIVLMTPGGEDHWDASLSQMEPPRRLESAELEPPREPLALAGGDSGKKQDAEAESA